MRASSGEDLVSTVLIGSGVPFTHANGAGLFLCAFCASNKGPASTANAFSLLNAAAGGQCGRNGLPV
jgi:hypothetical protein